MVGDQASPLTPGETLTTQTEGDHLVSLRAMASNVPPAPATEEAIGLVRHCKTVLEEHAYQIRAESNITDALNGPQGHVSAKTVNSVQLMEWGLGRLAGILGEYDYQAPDLLTCMTLDVENCHATVHSKKVNVSKLEYARSFGATMKESIRTCYKLGCVLSHQWKVLVPKARHNGVSS